MTSYRKSMVFLLKAIGFVAISFIAVFASMSIVETGFRKVHPSERQIADFIMALGGAYHADRNNDRHITGVWLQDTTTSDKDLGRVMQLPYLQYLDISNTNVTDASLDIIFGHKNMELLRVSGSSISRNALKAALREPGHGIILDEDRIALDK